mmetsp:Transcript_26437/g.66690  ORF Transcript_26437/g.66690 Transcript_26437/m.66690 type:complete len:161 (+) Transcript_26437:154-636(+)|eukprot:CAMPEP_0178990840 /NCGR_PEP_ID=MMETSP0795-20121207/5189_1 /TAXON_ID=88552 /ORGANISM="Amoebophrya sp., Strain Ameob2" /LENGTH=160 /DNA_ID=CAMNT_0020682469 /DNA_START=115 /DNA_END=597 /DNA_ORIENTATION=+
MKGPDAAFDANATTTTVATLSLTTSSNRRSSPYPSDGVLADGRARFRQQVVGNIFDAAKASANAPAFYCGDRNENGSSTTNSCCGQRLARDPAALQAEDDACDYIVRELLKEALRQAKVLTAIQDEQRLKLKFWQQLHRLDEVSEESVAAMALAMRRYNK